MRLKQDLSFFRIQQKSKSKGSVDGFSKNLDFRAFLLFIGLSCSISPAFANAASNTILCKSEKSVRTLRADKAADGGCRAVYTKQGVDQVVGSSTRENGCVAILQNIRQTLEGSAWKCKEIKSGVVSHLSP